MIQDPGVTPHSPLAGPASLPRPRRRRGLTVLLALAIFVAGLTTGVGLTVVVAVHRVRYALQHPEQAPQRITARLQRRLGMSHAQAAQVQAILAQRQAGLLEIRRETQPRVMVELDRAYQEISTVLDASQREHWQKMYQELKDDWLPPAPPPAG